MNNKQKLTNLMEYTIVPAILEDLDIDIDDTEAVIQAFKTLQGLIDNEIEAIKKVDLFQRISDYNRQ